MAVHAHFEEAGGRNREPRRTLLLEAQGVTPAGDPAHVLIHNVSATGLLLETQAELAPGQLLTVDLPQAGPTPAVVVWQSGQIFGCQFEMPVGSAVLSAAQLRGAVEPRVEIATRAQPASTEGLGPRLQRLRKDLGISQGQLAAQLGVSKPTVWAWEQGKSRPVESRIAPLAEALGVAPGELLPGQEDPALRTLLASCRDRIGAAMGVNPGKVRITLEL